jgi:hypothetical protein
VRTNEEPRPELSYIYGRFSLATHGIMLLQPGAVGDANLNVECDSGELISIAFVEGTSVQLLQLKPSRCALAEMVFKNAIGYTLESKPTQIASIKFDFAPGKAYYIGDWNIDIDRTMRGGKIHSRMRWKVSDSYEATTQGVKNTYPLFASFSTENRLKPPRSDAFVNCVSKGKRIWTYESKCD